MSASPSLTVQLAERIRREGPVAFSDFMEAALYHDPLGYYSDPARRIGRAGDFYTSVSVGSLFGELLADFVAGVWRALGSPASWVVAEQGGHDGSLARDVLVALRTRHPAAMMATTCVMVEARGSWRKVQQATFKAAELEAGVRWVDGVSEIPPGAVLFLSNELVDAFPVDRVCFREGVWNEQRVGWAEEERRFVWNEVPAAETLGQWADGAGLPRAEGCVAEARRVAELWARDLYQNIFEGVVLTIDYGYLAGELYGAGHPEGTLRAYAAHRGDPDPLADPGVVDLTAHVDFSQLRRLGDEAGWETRGYLDQHRFLTALAALPGGWLSRQEEATLVRPRDPMGEAGIRQFRTLTHPEIMGRVFRVLVQAKGTAASVSLPGLEFLRAGEAGV